VDCRDRSSDPPIGSQCTPSNSWGVHGWWLLFREKIGQLVNLAGLPGFLRECDYDAGITDANISVRVHPLFTVVRVNGLDIYFHRITGVIDGVGVSQTSGCSGRQDSQSIDFGEPPVDLPEPARTEIQSGHSE
jgi:hypothetical protein